jgi:hypothetical protein
MPLQDGAIKFCVNTCKNFHSKSLPVLLPSLYKAGVGRSEIVIISGGHSTFEMTTFDEVQLIKTQQNSIDFTALVEIVERQLPGDYWFYLHDTSIVGPSFKTLVYDTPSDSPLKVAMRNSPSMNIGLYSATYLHANKDRLLAAKNTDHSEEAIQYWKKWGVYNEDHMLWRESSATEIYHPDRQVQGDYVLLESADVYGTGYTRRMEYYPSLDLLKTKNNWQGIQNCMRVTI